MGYDLNYAYKSICGHVRNSNQDNIYINGSYQSRLHQDVSGNLSSQVMQNGDSFCVFDGVGGGSEGETASWIAARTFAENVGWLQGCQNKIQCVEYIHDIHRRMNKQIYTYADDKKYRFMGTTVAGITFFEDEYIAFNVGDSRIYRFCDNHMNQISRDHVLKDWKKKKSVITQYLGIPEDEGVISPDVYVGTIHPKDIIMLCSDGVTEILDDEEISACLALDMDLPVKIDYMMHLIEQRGAVDNTTIVLIQAV